MEIPETKSFYRFTVTLVLILTTITAIYINIYSALSCFSGGVFGILIFWLMDVAAKGFFRKKSVAITGSVIVFKYAILGIILYFAMNSPIVHKAGFLIGFLCFLPGSVFWVIKVKKT